MVRRIGFGRKPIPEAPPAKNGASKSQTERELGGTLAKRLIALGIGWITLVSLVTLRVVLNYSVMRISALKKTQENGNIKEDCTT